MKQSIYLETTIPSYLTALKSSDDIIAGRQEATKRWWETQRHTYDLYTSDYTTRECRRGNPQAAQKRLDCLNGIELLSITDDIEPLANVYLSLISISENSKLDAYHLAICCRYEIDILLSWNFKHLGSLSMLKIDGYNKAHGIMTPYMVAPDHLLNIELEDSL
jgi:predicted nucleic acid-binding protein